MTGVQTCALPISKIALSDLCAAATVMEPSQHSSQIGLADPDPAATEDHSKIGLTDPGIFQSVIRSTTLSISRFNVQSSQPR